MKQNYDEIINKRQDLYDPDAIQHKYSNKLGIRYTQGEDPYLQEQYKGKKNQN